MTSVKRRPFRAGIQEALGRGQLLEADET